MYWLLRSNYERGVPVDRGFLRKTARLVQEHTETGIIQAPEKIHRLDAKALETIAGGDKPDTVKVFNLLKSLHDMVQEQAAEAPYLISIGDKAEEIARAFEERQKTTQDTLRELEALLRELREAEQQRTATELTPEGFAVYWLLKREGVVKVQEVAQAVAEAFEQHPHWQSSGHQEQEVRRSLYKAFINAGIDNVVELAQSVMRMLRRASS